jgi:hypothetical protein
MIAGRSYMQPHHAPPAMDPDNETYSAPSNPEQKSSFASLSVENSRCLQIFLLYIILLLPDLDPTLRTLINLYLATPNANVADVHDDPELAPYPPVGTACKPAASSSGNASGCSNPVFPIPQYSAPWTVFAPEPESSPLGNADTSCYMSGSDPLPLLMSQSSASTGRTNLSSEATVDCSPPSSPERKLGDDLDTLHASTYSSPALPTVPLQEYDALRYGSCFAAHLEMSPSLDSPLSSLPSMPASRVPSVVITPASAPVSQHSSFASGSSACSSGWQPSHASVTSDLQRHFIVGDDSDSDGDIDIETASSMEENATLGVPIGNLNEERRPAEPTVLQHGGEVYTVLGQLGTGSTGRVMYARTRDDYPVAIKIVHKPQVYRLHCGRANVMVEKETLERVTTVGKPFLTKLLASWDDGENVYFVMVSVYVEAYHNKKY